MRYECVRSRRRLIVAASGGSDGVGSTAASPCAIFGRCTTRSHTFRIKKGITSPVYSKESCPYQRHSTPSSTLAPPTPNSDDAPIPIPTPVTPTPRARASDAADPPNPMLNPTEAERSPPMAYIADNVPRRVFSIARPRLVCPRRGYALVRSSTRSMTEVGALSCMGGKCICF
ncbi:hypothetical protein HD554DRAFT_8603 [Boletus coccyginus]|nr:hypothetical protein HD554DRAFT_8603 [Boletus coccyginus]